MSKNPAKTGFFRVISRDQDGNERVETERTDRKVAEEDVGIIKTILGRAAWIEGDE